MIKIIILPFAPLDPSLPESPYKNVFNYEYVNYYLFIISPSMIIIIFLSFQLRFLFYEKNNNSK